jgi:riboflavin kinase/FMN adenylyltransferase
VDRAAALLGYHYRFRGTVIQGENRGRTIGFPTANIRPSDSGKLIPGRGVYLAGVRHNGTELFGMMNIGTRPTFSDSPAHEIEVHVFGLSDDLYGEELEITLLRRLRDEQRFATTDELVLQLKRDREESMKLISEFKKQVS